MKNQIRCHRPRRLISDILITESTDIMTTTRGKRILISFRSQKECVESKLDGYTDSHSDNSAHQHMRSDPGIFAKRGWGGA